MQWRPRHAGREPSEAPPPLRTSVSELLGVDYPLVQAPMGFIARAQLASAVSNAGGFGIIETSSGRLNEVREEMAAMRDLTDKPWGVNIAQMLVSDPHIVEFVAEQGVGFVTTSAGDPERYTEQLHDAGITVFHVVPSLRAARKAVDAGVDGLVVEGGEGGGFKSTKPVSTMVLLPQICGAFDVPVIAAGGIVDGISMAAAFALGAEGVQMGTRMVSAAESPVHENYKQTGHRGRRHRHRRAQRPLEPGLQGHADTVSARAWSTSPRSSWDGPSAWRESSSSISKGTSTLASPSAARPPGVSPRSFRSARSCTRRCGASMTWWGR